MIRRRVASILAVLLIGACATSSSAPDASTTAPATDAAAEAGEAAAELADAAAADADAADAALDAATDATLPGTSEGCPAGMVLVHGDYCPEVNQVCLEHHDEYNRDEVKKKGKRDRGEDQGKSTVSERCLRYKEPTECLSRQRRPLRFCVDRYEWPNQKGELPSLLISWTDARKECEKIGKRLCTEDEFNFACEGEQMLPYTYGYARDAAKCNIDRQYRKREKKLLKYASCLEKPECKKELAKLDQRLPAGSLAQCVSPFGVYDLNGNINEWVFRPKEKPPNRSGLKGGWWGPVRGRCRPTVGFHKEDDYGYEEGFRCCKDAAAP
jgi:formylglycine-generating enzyme